MKTEAQQRATFKYDSKSYEKITLRVRKDTEPTRDTITTAASSAGLSLNAYILEAIKEKLARK